VEDKTPAVLLVVATRKSRITVFTVWMNSSSPLPFLLLARGLGSLDDGIHRQATELELDTRPNEADVDFHRNRRGKVQRRSILMHAVESNSFFKGEDSASQTVPRNCGP
jgi:hypothetical protein